MRDRQIRRIAKKVSNARLPLAREMDNSGKGQTLVEMALVMMVFFFVVFALIDFSWAVFSQMNMQDAVHQAGRFASTGQSGSINTILHNYAAGTNIESVVITSTAPPGTAGIGGPGDTVNIKVYCDVPLMTLALGNIFGTSDNKFHFTVSTTYKNEPFPVSQTTK